MARTDDAFLGGALRILQPEKGYRAGVDAVILAAAVPYGQAGEGLRVLDAGAGVGTAGLCVAARCRAHEIVLVDREPELCELAEENVRRNGLESRVRVVHADIIGGSVADLAACGVEPDKFDCVIANPPFHTEGAGTAARSSLKAGAHAMPASGLESWCRFLARMSRPGGCALVIHKVEALAEILAGFDRRFGGIKILPIHARSGEPAIRVLVYGIKGSRAPLSVLAGAVLHESGNDFTPGAQRVLRLGGGIDLNYWKGLEAAS